MAINFVGEANRHWGKDAANADHNADTRPLAVVPVAVEPDSVEEREATNASASVQQRGGVKRGRPSKSTPAPQASAEVGCCASVGKCNSAPLSVYGHIISETGHGLPPPWSIPMSCHPAQVAEPEVQQTKKRKLLSKADTAALGRAANPSTNANAPSDAAPKQNSARNSKSRATPTAGAKGRRQTVSMVCICHGPHLGCTLTLPCTILPAPDGSSCMVDGGSGCKRLTSPMFIYFSGARQPCPQPRGQADILLHIQHEPLSIQGSAMT